VTSTHDNTAATRKAHFRLLLTTENTYHQTGR